MLKHLTTQRGHNLFAKLIITFLFLPIFAAAQNADSVKQSIYRTAAAKFAAPKPFSIDYKRAGGYNFSSDLNGLGLPNGETTNWSQFTAAVNLTFPLNKRLFLQTSAFYRSVSADTRFSAMAQGLQNSYDERYQYHTEGAGLMYISKLFGKPFISSAGVYADGSEKGYERIRGLFTGTFVLKADAKTKMNAGLMVSTDPSILFPVFPVFSYERKMSNNFTADIMLPRYVYLRKQMFGYGRLSAGAELDGQTTFFLYNRDQTGLTYQYRQMEVNTGLMYEHLLPGNFTLSVRGGYRVVPVARTFDKSASFSDYIFKANADPAPYINIGLAFDPFSRPARR